MNEALARRVPFPLLAVDRAGRLCWHNPAADGLVHAWGTGIGQALPADLRDRIGLLAERGQDGTWDQQIGDRPWELHLCPEGEVVLIAARDRTREATLERRLLVADRAPALHPDPILRVTGGGRLDYANRAAEPLLALWGTAVGEELPPDWARTAAEVAREGRPRRDLLEHTRGVWALWWVPDPADPAVYLFAHDARRAAQDPAEPPADHFVANMGHELRTPLNAITGYAELVQDELRARGLDEAVQDLDKVRGAAARLRGLIDAMVDLARLQAGRIRLQPAPFYLPDVVDELLVQVGPRAEAHRDTLRAEIQADPPYLEADPERLRQILGALLDNACKFTRDGEITLRVRDLDHRGSRAVAFEVHDTGIGLHATELARLFRPYAQADASARRKAEGAGLGLVIARLLARAMGGEIDVRSEPGRGSTFRLILPREPPAP